MQEKTGGPVQAVIYCRSAVRSAVTAGNKLEAQEARCRAFARSKGYSVAGVFGDDGVSGAEMSRPCLDRMTEFLRSVGAGRSCVVLVDDIARLSRSLDGHFALVGAIAEAGARLESPSIDLSEEAEAARVNELKLTLSRFRAQHCGPL